MNLNLLKSKASPKPLICHFYETAYTAECLMEGYFNKLTNQISHHAKIDVQNVRNCVLFFAFLHDIGKIHPAFQFKIIPDVMEDLGYENKTCAYEGFRHEHYSKKILDNYISQKYGKVKKHSVLGRMSDIIACHHQGKSDTIIVSPKEAEWTLLQQEVIEIAERLFPFKDTAGRLDERCRNGLYEMLLGIIHTADWMASTQSVYDDSTIEDFSCEKDYIAHLKMQCNKFIDKNLMGNQSLHDRFHTRSNFWNLLLGKYSPRPMQEAVEQLTVSKKENSLLFIEDSCGGGKTEAALFYALSQSKHINGLYFALPTTATSENMRRRVSDICHRGIGQDFKVPVYNSMAWMQDEDVRLDSSLWESDAKLKMFYPIAVGTVDQLINTVQGVKHSDLGLVALSNKTLIIDEMHAYDAYMLEELKTLFSYCSLMGVSVIVLSATMPLDTKKQLIMAYNNADEYDTIDLNGCQVEYNNLPLSMGYPLITKVTSTVIIEKQVSGGAQLSYEYQLIGVKEENYTQIVFARANARISAGGTIVVVVNTVAHSIELYDYIKTQNETLNLGIEVHLLHSHFSIDKKTAKTDDILRKYGKDRTVRPHKSILISTQIIEQSLDVDFDFEISELAPIDILFQRAGRERRHSNKGTIREKIPCNGPCLEIFYFENSFGKSAYVYEKSILEASLNYLRGKSILRSPDDIRESIETVYQPKNINYLKQAHKTECAELVTIGKIDATGFWRFDNLASLRNDTHTRYESIPTTNIIVLTPSQIQQLQNGMALSRDAIVDIIKTQMYSSISCKKIKELPRVELDVPYLNEYHIISTDDILISDEYGLQI